MTGGAVSGPVILGGAGPELFLDRAGARRCGSVGPGVRLVRGRLAAHAGARAARRRPAAQRWTGSGSRTSPTSTSARSRAALSRGGARPSGCARAGPTSSSSPATCSRGRADARRSTRRWPVSTPSPCSATTTSRSRAIRSRAPPSSTGCRGRCSSTSPRLIELRGVPVQVAGTAPRVAGPVPEPDAAAAFRILLSHYPACARPATSSCSPGTCTQARSCFRIPAGRSASRISGRPLSEGVYRRGRRHAARLARSRHDVRPLPLLRPARGDRAGSKIGIVEGHSVISPDVLARYAADAAREVRGVHGLVGGVRGVHGLAGATTASRSCATTSGSASSSIWRWRGERTQVWSARRFRRTSPIASPAWPTSVPTPST